MLDNMVFDEIKRIGKGYISAYVYDCQSDRVKALKPDENNAGFTMNIEKICVGMEAGGKTYMPSF
jgi:hypothetical protein